MVLGFECKQTPKNKSILFPTGSYVIGRKPDSDLYIEERSVSRVHARLTVHASGEIELEDLKSRNGTFVNGKRHHTCFIVPGDDLHFGRVSVKTYATQGEAGGFELSDSNSTDDERLVSPEPEKRAPKLTKAQQRVFEHLITGAPEKDIAKTLELSQYTIHNHVRVIFQVYGVRSKSQLIHLHHTGGLEPE